jgi:general secretion pathway protein I
MRGARRIGERRARGARGFTLLEIMVAIAILGLGLTAILSAQAGAFASTAHTKNISLSVGLARCKMTELEEHLFIDGFQELDETDSGPCCNDEEAPGMRCSWRIEKPQLPEPKYGDLDLNAGLNLDTPSGSGASGMGALGAFSQMGQAGPSAAGTASPGDIAQQLAGGEGGAPDVSGLVNMAMTLVYPSLKTIFDLSARRITVTVTWNEGNRERSFEISQWVTSGVPAGLAAANAASAASDALGGDNPLPGGGTTGGGNKTGGASDGPRTNPSSGGGNKSGGGMR